MQSICRYCGVATLVLLTSCAFSFAQTTQTNLNSSVKIGIINTKKALEGSKLGKQEQANFEKMKGQMESVLQEKEQALQELEGLLNDDDHMDSLKEEAASELKQKKRNLMMEGGKLQSQYLQMLQQANQKVVQKLTELVTKASAKVAEKLAENGKQVFIISDEACTYFPPDADATDVLIVEMDRLYDAQPKDAVPTTAGKTP